MVPTLLWIRFQSLICLMWYWLLNTRSHMTMCSHLTHALTHSPSIIDLEPNIFTSSLRWGTNYHEAVILFCPRINIWVELFFSRTRYVGSHIGNIRWWWWWWWIYKLAGHRYLITYIFGWKQAQSLVRLTNNNILYDSMTMTIFDINPNPSSAVFH